MVFSPLDALILRRRPRSAQRRVELFVGALIALVGTPCGYFTATTLLGQVCWPAVSLAVGIYAIADGRRDGRHELAEMVDEGEAVRRPRNDCNVSVRPTADVRRCLLCGRSFGRSHHG